MSKVLVKGAATGTGVLALEAPSTNTDRTITLPDAGGQVHTSGAANDHGLMPTVNGDPIVESGSNSDGEWTRWADGTQKCYTAFAGYDGGSGGNTWTFPVSFSSAAKTGIELRLRDAHYGSASLLLAGGTTTSVAVYKYDDTQGSNTGASDFRNYNLEFQSTGRWK